LILLSKEYALGRRSVWIAAKLPGVERRRSLEELAWRAVQEAIEYTKSEDAAKNARFRLLALRVADGLIRTELAILDSMDWAYVEDIVESVEENTGELEKEVKARLQEQGQGTREPLQSEPQKEPGPLS
jgi:nucleotide-binding universal stress UspA family protein